MLGQAAWTMSDHHVGNRSPKAPRLPKFVCSGGPFAPPLLEQAISIEEAGFE